MKAGSLTVNKAAASLAGNVSAGASSVVMGQFEVKAVGENMEIRKMGLGVDAPLQASGAAKILPVTLLSATKLMAQYI